MGDLKAFVDSNVIINHLEGELDLSKLRSKYSLLKRYCFQRGFHGLPESNYWKKEIYGYELPEHLEVVELRGFSEVITEF
ncbi:MAG: hypothetical protein PWR13_1074 [Archaeoglobi archaeon]|nr:hypothetical protein [Archaeoglobi archaeon]MDK2782046.1 hypothetical protein [Archaeoglobi archaeon]